MSTIRWLSEKIRTGIGLFVMGLLIPIAMPVAFYFGIREPKTSDQRLERGFARKGIDEGRVSKRAISRIKKLSRAYAEANRYGPHGEFLGAFLDFHLGQLDNVIELAGRYKDGKLNKDELDDPYVKAIREDWFVEQECERPKDG